MMVSLSAYLLLWLDSDCLSAYGTVSRHNGWMLRLTPRERCKRINASSATLCMTKTTSNRRGNKRGILHREERGEVKMDFLSPRLHLASAGNEVERPWGRGGGGGAGRRRRPARRREQRSPGRESMASPPSSSSESAMGRTTDSWCLQADSSTSRPAKGRAARDMTEKWRALRFGARWGGREAGARRDPPPSSSPAEVGSRRGGGSSAMWENA
jgi:hypothetical protein